LHTGSTPAVRQTAARQLGDVQKQHPHELPNLMSRVLQHLRSKQWETRVAAGQAIEAIALNVASWQPSADADEMIKQEMNTDDVAKRLKQAEEKERLSFATFDISEVMRSGRQLLASAGKEYDIDLAGLDPQERLAAQRRDLKRTLGMGSQFMDVDLMDEADLNITVTTPKTSASASPAPTAAATATPPASDLPDPLSNPNLSKRELNALKRRLKQKEKSKAK
jgi:TATA-binding protein-associated factor